MRSIHTDLDTRAPGAQLYYMVIMESQERCVEGCETWKATVCAAAGTVSRRVFLVTRKRRCTSSTSCFADTARCQARIVDESVKAALVQKGVT